MKIDVIICLLTQHTLNGSTAPIQCFDAKCKNHTHSFNMFFLNGGCYRHKLKFYTNFKYVCIYIFIKGPYAITFSSPRAQPEVVYFLYQMKAHIFLIANPKFQLQILCSFGDLTKSVKLNGIPENNFLCIFIIASSLRGAYFLLPLESKQEATSG